MFAAGISLVSAALSVAFPGEGQSLPAVERTYVIGAASVSNTAPLVVNGATTDVWRTGAFLAMAPVTPGTNTLNLACGTNRLVRRFVPFFKCRERCACIIDLFCSGAFSGFRRSDRTQKPDGQSEHKKNRGGRDHIIRPPRRPAAYFQDILRPAPGIRFLYIPIVNITECFQQIFAFHLPPPPFPVSDGLPLSARRQTSIPSSLSCFASSRLPRISIILTRLSPHDSSRAISATVSIYQ